MDMQTKVIIRTWHVTKSGKDFEEPVIREIDILEYPDFFLGSDFFQFTEHLGASIKLNSDDVNSFIEIAAYDSEEIIILKPDGSEYELSTGGETENMIVPGYYEIKIHTLSKTFEGLYRVAPSTLSWVGLMKIRDYLEDILEGLSYNLYWKKLGKQGEAIINNSFTEMYKHIVNNEKMLINLLESLIKDPITNLSNQYKERSYSQRPDMKSQKWLSRKGISVNTNPYIPEKTYEKHCIMDKDTLENKWIKKILVYTIHIIVRLERSYVRVNDRLKKEMLEKEIEFDKYKLQYKTAVNARFVTANFRSRLFNKINIISKSIAIYKEKVSFTEKTLFNLKKIKNSLARYQYETWISEISGYEKVNKPSLKMLKESRCLKLYNFYKDLVSLDKNTGGNKTSFLYKKTSLLFEFYTVAIIIERLVEKGYNWRNGWIKDVTDPIVYNGELQEETAMLFENDQYICELIYDKEVARTLDNPLRSQLINVNSAHNRPDIRLSLYDKETDDLLSVMIIEAKCSKSRNIYNKDGDTRAVEQIRDYSSFRCYDAKLRRYSHLVSKVVLVYPKQQPRINYPDTLLNCIFVQIDPVGNNESKDELSELYGVLDNFLELEDENEDFVLKSLANYSEI